MKATDVVELLSTSIESARSAGTASVPIERLQLFVNEIKNLVKDAGDSNLALTDGDLEHYKAKLNAWIAEIEFQHEQSLEMFRSVMSSALAALKTVLLVNGAAAIAMLAFIGNIWATSKGTPVISSAACAVNWYVSGVLMAGLASAFTYLTQAGYGNGFGKYSQKIGIACHAVTVILVLASYGVFGYASSIAYTAFVRV
ncbi:MAG: hypothetical protein K2X64_03430 [Rhodocyclaceae bacterium]|nr:hypothetical protein [Rhodocyclaceae bacterium]